LSYSIKGLSWCWWNFQWGDRNDREIPRGDRTEERTVCTCGKPKPEMRKGQLGCEGRSTAASPSTLTLRLRLPSPVSTHGLSKARAQKVATVVCSFKFTRHNRTRVHTYVLYSTSKVESFTTKTHTATRGSRRKSTLGGMAKPQLCGWGNRREPNLSWTIGTLCHR